MNTSRNLHNPNFFGANGFSLIEMMIVVTVMGTAIFGMISMSSQQVKLSKTMTENTSFNELRTIILQTAGIKNLCQNAAVPTGTPVPIDMTAASTTVQTAGAEIAFNIPGGVVQKDQPIMGNDLTVQSFRVNNAFNTGADSSIPGNDLWSAQLWLRAEHNGDVFGAKVLKERFLGFINLSITPASELQSCYSLSGSGGGSAASNIVGTCPAGTMMTGIGANGVICNAVTAPIGAPSSAWTPSNPGPGCIGTRCFTYDYGPCDGIQCRTNGNSCTGIMCCAGPACFP